MHLLAVTLIQPSGYIVLSTVILVHKMYSGNTNKKVCFLSTG